MMNKMIKKALITFTAAALVIGAGTSAGTVYANDGMGVDSMGVSVSDYTATKYVTASSANVRTAPSTDSRILHSLSKGECVQVDGHTSNGWVRIWTSDPVYGGTTAGYIAENLLSGSKGSSQSTSGSQYTTQVSDGYLALRNAASYDINNEIGALYNGSVVQTTGEKCGDYVKVKVIKAVNGSINYGDPTGKTGYVNANYLK